MIPNIFIDTNIFLGFYDNSPDDLPELERLLEEASAKTINIWLPEQMKDEFYRNREEKIASAIDKLRDENIGGQPPHLVKDFPESQHLIESRNKFFSMKKQLIDKVKNTGLTSGFKVDNLVDEIFKISTTINTTDDIVNSAVSRKHRGNPPGKGNSLGDQINWEALLKHVPDGDITIVSADGDYFGKLDGEKASDFLEREWKARKGGKLLACRRLSKGLQLLSVVLNQNKAIQLAATKLAIQRLIGELQNSPNFQTTHSVIAELENYNEFDEQEILSIISAYATNNQVLWILGDIDVSSFIKRVVNLGVPSAAEVYYQRICDAAKAYGYDNFFSSP